MSHARLTTSAPTRLAAARPSGSPFAPRPANIIFSSLSPKSRAPFTTPRVYTIGSGSSIPTVVTSRWLASTTTPANHRPSTKQQPSSSTHHDINSPAGGAPAQDTISFKSLGMTRGVKAVVYTALGIFGTMETIFWTKVLWRWWTGKGEDGDEPQA
ncbi:hypothetical protein F4810DRAFT_135149 [Camillea tinctor]|nr:hypothetical protein F4810DRAFT_135149 [Camillea tinctor]